MTDVFKQFPRAKSLWKVGDKYFLHAFKHLADAHAVRTNSTVEEVKPAQSTNKQNKGKDGSK